MTKPDDGGRADSLPAACLTYRDLMGVLRRGDGPVPALTAPDLKPEDPVLHGRFRLMSMRCGLSLHATDATDAVDLTTHAAAKPGLTVALFLRGDADISLGDRRFRITAGTGPKVFLLARAEPDLFIRRGMRGNRVRKLSINVPPDWLADDPLAADRRLRLFAETHGASAGWAPSAGQIRLAERLTGPTPYRPSLEGLYLESHALELVAELLAVLSGGAGDPSGGRTPGERDLARIRRVRDYLHAQDGACPRLEDIARHAGMSVSVLQRLFRAVYGTTVADYHRSLRMDRARRLLERDGVTVTEAAYAAGYDNPANFSTAFKRRFGLSPREARAVRVVV
ncbi:helix-turn-helix domain-containing protein [Azospirillum thermophilum]|uniref:AraC family transcriptional regulator n=1 Tax=Azospirillum thermophilum TaxID=2202148 RepID=A0A2S2CZ75_9PROT|nr:AraC family transcriptional regulator [Azospirillum thermophilum]AWK89745.1 AraC family transcriptional regulator [Azospirillum thermophilum]